MFRVLISALLFAVPAQFATAQSAQQQPAPNPALTHASFEASRQPLDACGGRKIFDAMVPDGVFLEACRTHDACYRSYQSDQHSCDRLFLTDMRDACEATYPDADKPLKNHACRSVALTYFQAVNSRFGAVAFADVPVSGAFTAYKQDRLTEADGTDEIQICTDFQNTAARIQRFEIKLRDARGKWVDTEPNFQQVKLRPGETGQLCMDSDNALHRNWDSIGDTYSLTLYADDPSTLNPIGDQIVVDRLDCIKADEYCVKSAP